MINYENTITHSNKPIVGFTCGTFDMCHPGHSHFFEYCKKHCDILIVGLQVDATLDRPEKQTCLEPIHLRSLRLYQNKDVDYVLTYTTEESLAELLSLMNIDIRFLDSSYEDKDFTHKDNAYYEIHYTPRNHGISSSLYRNKISGCK